MGVAEAVKERRGFGASHPCWKPSPPALHCDKGDLEMQSPWRVTRPRKTLLSSFWGASTPDDFKLVDPACPHFDKHDTLSSKLNLKFERTNQFHRTKCWFLFRADNSSLQILRRLFLFISHNTPPPPPTIIHFTCKGMKLDRLSDLPEVTQ